jgi:hypothetical protein
MAARSAARQAEQWREGGSAVIDDANVGLFVLCGERRDDLHGDSPSLLGIPCVRNCKLDMVPRKKDAALTAVGLGELNESSSLRCRIHLQFHEGQHTVGGSGTKSRYQDHEPSTVEATNEAANPQGSVVE